MKRRRIVVIILLIFTLVTAGAAIYIGFKLQGGGDTAPDTSEAAPAGSRYLGPGCNGQCDSGSQCNGYGNSLLPGEMVSCYLVSGSTYGCYAEAANSGGNSCYLRCSPYGWAACNCDLSGCQTRCAAEHAGQTGTFTRVETCGQYNGGGCGQSFMCSCTLTATPPPTTPPVTPPPTTPPVTQPPGCPYTNVDTQFWVQCPGEPSSGCGLGFWGNGGNVTTYLNNNNITVPNDLDINCFASGGQNGIMNDAYVELRINGNLVNTYNTPSPRNINLVGLASPGSTIQATCISSGFPSDPQCRNADSFTLASNPPTSTPVPSNTPTPTPTVTPSPTPSPTPRPTATPTPTPPNTPTPSPTPLPTITPSPTPTPPVCGQPCDPNGPSCADINNVCVEDTPGSYICVLDVCNENPGACNPDQCSLIDEIYVEKSSVEVCEPDASESLVTYTIVIRNPQPNARTIDAIDTHAQTIPAEYLVEGSINPSSGVFSDGVITWTNLALPANDSITLTYQLLIPESAFGEYTNTVVIEEGGEVRGQDTHLVNVDCLPPTALISENSDRLIIGVMLILTGFMLYRFGIYNHFGEAFWKIGGKYLLNGILPEYKEKYQAEQKVKDQKNADKQNEKIRSKFEERMKDSLE
ncbi:hypothetical protein KC909_04810 [Candidatus Dojkabacteria bacterium]|uniref:DUF11 domain-containing protein n=1 Tax=Candidatus Dojkabacteria bacterium TaxID=2099670 RepID=A0A955L6P7_9BACT|nr:hypothetical protein [Candidatus Dojkabacteria bacterium]